MQDKTFGLKNKKGKKQQEYVKAVQNQVRQPKSNEEKKVGAKHVQLWPVLCRHCVMYPHVSDDGAKRRNSLNNRIHLSFLA